MVLGFAILAAGCRVGLRGRWLVLAWSVLAVAAAAAVTMPAYYFVILTHLHNLVPLVFLWEWAESAVCATRALGLPSHPGVVDRGASAADPGRSGRRVDRSRPGGGRTLRGQRRSGDRGRCPTRGHGEWGLRFLVVFAFMQTMHYVVWVAFLPRFAPEAVAAFDTRVPWLRGRRAWLFGLVAGALVAALFVSDYFQGRALYAALASYHAYLEFPVLLALLVAPLGVIRPIAR